MENQSLSDEDAAKLKAEHGGRIIQIAHPRGSFAFAYPSRADVKLFRHRAGNKDDMASERMCRELCIWPSKEAFAEFLELYPFAADSIFGAVATAGGYTADNGELVVK